MSITHTVYRDDDETVIEVEATGKFYYGELDSWTFTSSQPVELTQDECDAIIERLIEDRADDWNEDGWKADRCRND